MHNESPLRVLAVATLVCVACSIVVSSAAVGLRPIQEANRLRDKQRYILRTAGYDKAETCASLCGFSACAELAECLEDAFYFCFRNPYAGIPDLEMEIDRAVLPAIVFFPVNI